MFSKTLIAVLLAAPGALALEVPRNIRDFYNNLKNQGDCKNKLADGFYNSEFEDGDMAYCGDHLGDWATMHLQGPGKFSNMDVDCDGAQGGPQDDGRCDDSTTTIPETSVADIIRGYDVGIDDLNSHVHSFVVFGNSNSNDKPDWPTFDPEEYGVRQASLMAVVCGDKMFYGIWGDSNGSHGNRASVGEVSISLATACYGRAMSAGTDSETSHDESDVLYIAFKGDWAVPGADGAAWGAETFEEFHESLVGLGNKLIKQIEPREDGYKEPEGDGDDGGDDGSDDCDDGEDDCSWSGHCAGASCKVAQDCAYNMTCINGQCGSP